MQLNYKKEGLGPALIIAHGLLGSLDNWMTLMKMFANDYTTYIVDLRNHGKSPWTDTHSYPEMANDLLEFMDQQGIANALLLGHSMGGKVVMQIALHAHERVSALVVADMAPVYYAPHHNQIFQALESVPITHLKSRNEADEYLSLLIPESSVRQFLLKNIDRTAEGSYKWKMNISTLKQEYENILSAIEGDKPYTGPVLVLSGGLSTYVKDEFLPAFRFLFPELEVDSIPGVGHWLHAEAPIVFYEKVRNFLKKSIS